MEMVVDSEHQFWDEIQEIVSTPCSSEDSIDDALRTYLSLAAHYRDEYLHSALAVSRCSYKLLTSSIFAHHGDYVRRQMIYGLLQDDDPNTLLLIASYLLFDGQQNEIVFRMMNEECAFPRLVELLQAQNKAIGDDGAGLHRLLMDLLYEMSRIQRIKVEDLVLVDDDFIKSLFNIIENLSYDVNDPYHYPVIRVLLVLNEQFMISAHDPISERSSTTLTNRVIKVLSMNGNLYKTFGENIILLINREAETSLQLLTLKLLYLIFTTPSTYEYFYTNDLHVLVDILIRNLLDLPEEAAALRHTYLRVLYPLLAHTQLRNPPFYKRDELHRMLSILVRGQLPTTAGEVDHEKIMHFDEVDETTRRLVARCATVDWLRETDEAQKQAAQRKDSVPDTSEIGTPLEPSQTYSSSGSSSDAQSPTRPNALSTPYAERKPSQAQRLGMQLEQGSSSSLSVQEVATQHEKPGIITPSRNDNYGPEKRPTHTVVKPKVKPLPPKARRWRGRRTHVEDEDGANAHRIPEESPIPPSPITPASPSPFPSAHLHAHGDRRYSAASTLAPPPVPAHARRSASNPPPAVPPPRRSAHPAVQHFSSHCTPVTSPSRQQHSLPPTPSTPGKHGQKPEPPKTRRWRAGSIRQDGADSPTTPNNTHPPEEAKVSVEEAVQSVSINDGAGR
ncbi:DUF2013 domain-containing protein [Aspergillus candidus]|uniref:SPIN90/Ldb17 leucine-rich domain-containing protein n=1 Tax=Aspergillus candidus TaxID=41067 RepID=A0A2I2F1M4_ASPCN|nr:hypothetical protein BDW47DRAFT_76512 [Aspergillus candidus]PLB34517.1 hypothetical protein BDW47DRAFT_76512 [Aspergillus candidus]